MEHIKLEKYYWLVQVNQCVKVFNWNSYETADKALDAAREWRDWAITHTTIDPIVQRFEQEMLVADVFAESNRKDVYKAYRRWAIAESESKILSPTDIHQYLASRFQFVKRSYDPTPPPLNSNGFRYKSKTEIVKEVYRGLRIRGVEEVFCL
jgi:hypothetical protein